MATTEAAVELLKSTLLTRQSSLDGRTAEINKAYKEAVALADKAHKESLALAKKTQDEALLEFNNDKEDIVKLKNAIKALTGESPKSKTAKAEKTGNPKPLDVPKTLEDATSNNQKIAFVVSQLGNATNSDIADKLKELGVDFKSSIGDLTGKLEIARVLKSERIAGKKVYSIA